MLAVAQVNAAAAPTPSAPVASGASPSPTQSPSRAEQLLDQTGAKGCTVTALTSTNERGLFIGLGLQATSSVTEAVTTDVRTPWEVTLSQGTALGGKFGVGVKVGAGGKAGVGASVDDPPLDGSAIGTALLGYAASETYDVATQAEADRIVTFGSDPLGPHDAATYALLVSSQQWVYTCGVPKVCTHGSCMIMSRVAAADLPDVGPAQ